MPKMTKEKMIEFLYELPEQFKTSLVMDVNSLACYRKDYANILISGLGGSAIGGDILKSYAATSASIPIIVNRDYTIPAFVNAKTLFFAISYSGNTEETINAYQEAHAKGAQIICITSGGKLADLARKNDNLVLTIPAGLVPRAATGYLFAPLALAMEQLGYLVGVKADIEETYEVLDKLRARINHNIMAPDNKARLIAAELKDSLPIIWGASGLSETAALRWKAQINENAKCPAYYNVFPELNHNEIVGFETAQDIYKDMIIVILKDGFDRDEIKRRMEITADIVRDKVKNIIEVESEGQSFLARFYSLVYMGDYVSLYLAIEYGINPTPVKIIDYLKEELAK